MFNDLVTRTDRRKLKCVWKFEPIYKMKVVDMNGVELKPGHIVVVHQDDEKRNAIVIEAFPDRPTLKEPGFWVDINCGEGIEGMMSYILEVIGVRFM